MAIGNNHFGGPIYFRPTLTGTQTEPLRYDPNSTRADVPCAQKGPTQYDPAIQFAMFVAIRAPRDEWPFESRLSCPPKRFRQCRSSAASCVHQAFLARVGTARGSLQNSTKQITTCVADGVDSPNTFHSLPKKRNVLYRALRHPRLMPYNRLIALVLFINATLFAKLNEPNLLNLALANFFLATLMRIQDFINWLFSTASKAAMILGRSWRCAAGKIYHFGGVHVGAYAAGSIWVAGAAVQNRSPVLALATTILGLIIVSSRPFLRSRYHNFFERVARYGNWTLLLIFSVYAIFTS